MPNFFVMYSKITKLYILANIQFYKQYFISNKCDKYFEIITQNILRTYLHNQNITTCLLIS